jgi:hypothetical protein
MLIARLADAREEIRLKRHIFHLNTAVLRVKLKTYSLMPLLEMLKNHCPFVE